MGNTQDASMILFETLLVLYGRGIYTTTEGATG